MCVNQDMDAVAPVAGESLGEAHLFSACVMEEPTTAPFLGGNACIFSTRSPDKTSDNEDCAALIPFSESSGVLLVADGMGGHASGEVASRLALEAMAESLHEGRTTGLLLRSAIINGFEAANTAVQALENGAGTTLAVAEICDGKIRTYHAGDSIILVVSRRGSIKMTTISHSLTGYAVEAGLMDAESAMAHDDRHLLLNALGSHDMRIDVGSPIELTRQDTVLVACDGLTDNLSMPEIAETVRMGKLQESVSSLVGRCREQMTGRLAGPSKMDDLTVVAFRGGSSLCSSP